MTQVTAFFNQSNNNVNEQQVTQIVQNNLVPITADLATRAKVIDENLQELTATADNTSFKHDRLRVSRKVFLSVSTTFSPLAPDNGWLHGDMGEIVVVHQQSNLTVGVSGIDDGAYNAAPATDKAAGAKWLRTYRIVDGDMVWSSRRLNSSPVVVPKRYFVKGNGGNAYISIPTRSGTTELNTSDNFPAISVLGAFKIEASETSPSTQILWSKGAGSSGTMQATVNTAGLLSIGMGNDASERLTFSDSVIDGLIHPIALTFKRGTTNNGILKAALDGTISSRADIANIVYNTNSWSILGLDSGFGTHAKMYYLYKFNRELTDAEIVDAVAGKIPSDYVVYYPFINNANDVGPSAIHGTAINSPTFSFENA